jgi:LPS export ABC transporter protein LptC
VDWRSAVAILLLAAAAGGTWLAAQRDDRAERAPALDPAAFTYYMRDARLIGADETGRVLYRIRADEARQQADGQVVTLADVDVEYTPQAEVPWTIASGRAEIDADSRLVHMSEGVSARTTDRKGQTTVIRTPDLVLDPDAYVASTEAKVDVTIGDGVLHGTGMTVDLKRERLQLESNVNGKFAP